MAQRGRSGNPSLNDAEFRQLIVAEMDAVYRLACHLTHARQDAEEVVQETFLRALRHAKTFTLSDHGVRPWLFKILHNAILSRGAKLHREHVVLDELRHVGHAADGDEGGSLCGTGGDGAPLDWDDVDERLKRAVADLPMPFRAAFLLSAVERLKYREIAEVTGVPVGTVMSRLSRARGLLASRLVDLANERRLHAPTRSPEAEPTP